jgi:3-oxoacyl-[acyl-carrier-protein] synthase-3
MRLFFKNKKISCVLSVLPENEISFEEEIGNYNFSVKQSLKLKSIMGFDKKRVVLEGITSSDLCVSGVEYLIKEGVLKKEDIDAIIFVSQSPDYIMPPTSNIIQGRLGLKEDMICLDINQGCAGYIIGLIESFMLLEQTTINKVVLLNADVLSPKVSKKDRNSNPLIGDGAAVTILEKSLDDSNIYCSLKMNGAGAFALHIPAGGAKMPINEQTGILVEDSHGNLRSKNHLVMKGDEVFNFVQSELPSLINNVLEYSNIDKNEIDYYLFHQPNKFMLNKLADKIGVDRVKMPANIVENFGNASGATIPINIAFNIADKIKVTSLKVCFSGFGVGLTWGAIIMDLSKNTYIKTINYK